MKIRVKKEEDKTTIMRVDGTILFVWYKETMGDKDVAMMIKKLFKDAEIIEE
jgi:hypothetical protein